MIKGRTKKFILGLVVAVLLISFAVLYLKNALNGRFTPSQIADEQKRAELLASIAGSGDNYALGSEEPLLTIVEFADFNCSICAESFPLIREFVNRNKKHVRFVFRDYPVLHDSSVNLALAGRCAGEQGFFWQMHDKLFISAGELGSEEDLSRLAQQIGLNENQYLSCYKSKKYLEDIKADYRDGGRLELRGTPTWFVNNMAHEGKLPVETLNKILNNLINKKDKK